MKLRSVFSACSARSSHWCCSCSNFALVTGSAAASAAAAHLRANCRRYSVRALIQSNRRGLQQGRHCLFRCGAERAACLAHSPRTGITKEGPFSFKPRTHIDAADQSIPAANQQRAGAVFCSAIFNQSTEAEQRRRPRVVCGSHVFARRWRLAQSAQPGQYELSPRRRNGRPACSSSGRRGKAAAPALNREGPPARAAVLLGRDDASARSTFLPLRGNYNAPRAILLSVGRRWRQRRRSAKHVRLRKVPSY